MPCRAAASASLRLRELGCRPFRVISPRPARAKKIRGWLERLGKPWVAHFTGANQASDADGPGSLEDAALTEVARARGTTHRPVELTLPADEITRLVRE